MRKSEIKDGVWFFRSLEPFGVEEVPWFLKEKAYNYVLFRPGNFDCYCVPKASLEVETDDKDNILQIVMRMPRRQFWGFWGDATDTDNIKTAMNVMGVDQKELDNNLNNKDLETVEVDFKENVDWIRYKLNRIKDNEVVKTAEFEAGVAFAMAMINDINLEPGAVVINAETQEKWTVE